MILAHPINYNFPLYFAFTSLSYRNVMYDNDNSSHKGGWTKAHDVNAASPASIQPPQQLLEAVLFLHICEQHLPTLIIQKEYLKLPLVRGPYDVPSQYCKFSLSSLRLLPNDKRMCDVNEGNLEAAPL